MQSIFGTDGIRGRFNEELTYSLAYKIGYALGSTLEKKSPIIISKMSIAFKFVFNSGSLSSDCIINSHELKIS